MIFVAGTQKLVPTLAAAYERIYQHSLPREAGVGTSTTPGVTGRAS